MKKRIRFGIRVPIFTNAATFVFYVSEAQGQRFAEGVENITSVLVLAGQSRLADRIVFDMA
jgi:hypothetical protein